MLSLLVRRQRLSLLSNPVASRSKTSIVPNIKTINQFFEQPLKELEHEHPKDNNEHHERISKDVDLRRYDGSEANHEEVDKKGVETNNKKHLR